MGWEFFYIYCAPSGRRAPARLAFGIGALRLAPSRKSWRLRLGRASVLGVVCKDRGKSRICLPLAGRGWRIREDRTEGICLLAVEPCNE